MSQKPEPCSIVSYKLSQDDVDAILRDRSADSRKHGNTPTAGEVLPLVIVRIWPDEFGPGIPGVNGQVLLDGNHTHWVTSRRDGTEHGTWSHPQLQTS